MLVGLGRGCLQLESVKGKELLVRALSFLKIVTYLEIYAINVRTHLLE